MSDDDCEIIDLATEARRLSDDRASVKTVGRTPSPCRHFRVRVNCESRTVACQECSAIVDPVEFILQLARKESRLDWVREELARLQKQLEELKRIERNTKARIESAAKRLDYLESLELKE